MAAAIQQVPYSTAPEDPRFSTTQDKGKQCWTVYNEWLRCMKRIGSNDPKCDRMQKYWSGLCPASWTETWEDARENGHWWGYKYFDDKQ